MMRRRIALLVVTPVVLVACVAIYLVAAGPSSFSAHGSPPANLLEL